MRVKAIPAELEKLVEVHPFLVGASVLVLGVGVYHYMNAGNPAATMDANPTASTQGGFSYGMPMVIPSGDTGMLESLRNPNAPTSVAGIVNGTASNSGTPTTSSTTPSSDTGGLTNLDIFNFEKLKESHDFDLANATLAANIAIAQSNADIAMMGIQSANWVAGVGLAQEFIRSGQQFSAGNIGGMTFAFLGTGTPLKFDPSKYASRNASAQMQIQAQQSSFASLLNNSFVQSLLGGSYVQPNTGTVSTPAYGGGTTGSSLSPVGSSGTTSSISGTSPSSSQPSIYDASSYQPASYGTSGGGSEGGTFYNRFSYQDATAIQ